jgi:hypothetical protein
MGEAALQLVRPTPRDKVCECLKSAGERSEGGRFGHRCRGSVHVCIPAERRSSWGPGSQALQTHRCQEWEGMFGHRCRGSHPRPRLQFACWPPRSCKPRTSLTHWYGQIVDWTWKNTQGFWFNLHNAIVERFSTTWIKTTMLYISSGILFLSNNLCRSCRLLTVSAGAGAPLGGGLGGCWGSILIFASISIPGLRATLWSTPHAGNMPVTFDCGGKPFIFKTGQHLYLGLKLHNPLFLLNKRALLMGTTVTEMST